MFNKKFISGYYSLDLAATRSTNSELAGERLAKPVDLDRWLKRRNIAPAGVQATEEDLACALLLGEALDRLLSAYLSRKPCDPAFLELINFLANKQSPYPKLEAFGRLGIRLQSVLESLVVVARDAVDLFGGWVATQKRIKKCPGEGCAFYFVDLSQSRRRQWCSMDTCGSKAKMDTFLRRKGLKP
jgi:predicted RNA-binding Zn ribbon-like protein